MIPTTAHLQDPWVMGYDLFPMDTLAFKRRFIREAIDREYLILFEHDPARFRRLHPGEREGAATRRAGAVKWRVPNQAQPYAAHRPRVLPRAQS